MSDKPRESIKSPIASNLESIALASGFSICKVTGAWSGGVSCRRELEKFAELVREECALACEGALDTAASFEDWIAHAKCVTAILDLKEQP